MDRRIVNRFGAAAGLIGVGGNILAVAVLRDIPSAYRPDTVSAWVSEVLASPVAASISGIGFTLGLVALAGWAVVVGARVGNATGWAGAFLIGAGALLNAAGTPAPLVVVHLLAPACGLTEGCHAAASAILGMSLALDATFNLLLGCGLVLIGLASRRAGSPLWVNGLTIAAGLASVPVSLQVFSPRGADLLLIAGPLWLLAITVSSVRMWRSAS